MEGGFKPSNWFLAVVYLVQMPQLHLLTHHSVPEE